MASKFTVPYAPSSVYRANNSIAELMLRAGAINAEGARRSGEIWGSTIANLGQQVGGAVADWQAQKQQKRAEEAKRQAVAQVENTVSAAKPTDDIEAIVSSLPPEYRDMARQKYMVIQGTRSKLREARDAHLKSWSEGLLPFLTGDESDIQKAELALSDLESEGFTEQAKRLRNQFRENPGTVKAMAMQMAGVKPEAPKTRTIKTRLADGSEVEQIVEDRPGQTFRSAAEPPKPPTSFDAAILAADQKGDVAEAKRLIARKAQAEAAGRKPDAPKDERIVQVMGPQGTPIWVKESEAVGKPAAQAPRAVTGAERTALGFFNRAKQAISDIAPIEEKVANSGLMRQLQLGYSGPGENLIKTQEQQAYRQAQRAFTEARLRKESGAAIPPAEYENDARTYFAQPGDTPATIEQKRRAREVVLGGLSYSAGRAYDEYYGEPAPKTPPSEVAKAVQVTAPNGKTYSFKNKAEADAFKKRAGIP